jgi:hypothetical protein
MYCHFKIQGTLKKAKKWSELEIRTGVPSTLYTVEKYRTASLTAIGMISWHGP